MVMIGLTVLGIVLLGGAVGIVLLIAMGAELDETDWNDDGWPRSNP